MSQLTVTQNPRNPILINQALDLKLRQLHNAMGQSGVFAADDAPTSTERRALANRQCDLDGWLAPVGPEEAKLMIAAVLGVMPVQGGKGSPEDAERVQKLYVRSLNDVPRFALQGACAAALKGEVGNGVCAPTPGELRQHAQRLFDVYERERRQIRSVLAAPVNDAPVNMDRKKRMLDDTRKWIEATRMGEQRAKFGRMTPAAIAEVNAVTAALDAGLPDPRPMPKIDAAFRATLERNGWIKPVVPAQSEDAA